MSLDNLFQPQINAANKMIEIFTGDEVRYILFRAPLQSGKTDTYQYLIMRMLTEGMVDTVYIVCGSNEKELLYQVKNDVRKAHGNDALDTKIHVVFRQHMKQTKMNSRRILVVNDESHMDCKIDQELKKFMSRHDLTMAGTTPRMRRDSVYVVSVSATPFAEEAVMAHGDSLPKAMIRLEVGNSYYGPAEYHRDGLLRPTYSVIEEEGRVKWVNEVRGVLAKRKYVIIRLRETVRQGKGKGKGKEKGKEKEKGKGKGQEEECPNESQIIKTLLTSLSKSGVRILRFTSKFMKANQQVAITSDDAGQFYEKHKRHIPCLEDRPEKPTIVILDGRLRCGKRIPKQHIGMTWDSAAASNTDVIVQGLVGRMCGYLGAFVGNVPERLEDRAVIYTCPSLFQRDENATLKLSDLERFDVVQKGIVEYGVLAEENGEIPIVVPRFATNLIRKSIQREMRSSGQLVHQCVPIRFQVEEELNPDDLGSVKQACLEAFRKELGRLVVGSVHLTMGQQEEICHRVGFGDNDGDIKADGCHVRRLQGSSQLGFFGQLLQAVRDGTGVKEHISDGPFLTFCVIFAGYQGLQAGVVDRAGTVYACIYTYAEGFRRTIPLASRIPDHNELTHFMRHVIHQQEVGDEKDEKEEKAFHGMGMYGFTAGIRNSPAVFEAQLDHFVHLARSGIGFFGRIFYSAGPDAGLRFSVEAYGEKREALSLIIARLESVHSIRIRHSMALRQPGRDYALIKKLWWEDA